MKNLYYLLGGGLLLGILAFILFLPRGEATISIISTIPVPTETQQPAKTSIDTHPSLEPTLPVSNTSVAAQSSNHIQINGIALVKDEQHYYLSNLDSSEMTPLDLPVNNHGMALSPNGQMIAFMPNNSHGLYILDLNTKVSTPLLVDTGIGLAWSMDNETIAFSCRVQGTIGFSLCLVNIKDAQNVQVVVKSETLGAVDSTDGVFSPSWSSDNQKIAFLAVKALPSSGGKSIPKRDIWLFDVSSQRAQKTFDDQPHGISYIFQPVFLPNENAILFSGRKDKFNSVFKYKIGSQQTEDLTQTGASFDLVDFVLSPDEKTFLGQSPLSNDPSQYVPTLYSIGGQQLEQLNSLKNLQIVSWSLSPNHPKSNEKFLLINGLDYYLSTLDGADSKLIFTAKHSLIAGLSPDQTQFAYFTDNFIYLQNIAEQKTRKVNQEILGGDVPGGSLKWSPDGKKLFTSCANAQQPSIAFCAIDISNGQVETLINEKNTDEICHKNQPYAAVVVLQDLSRDGTKIVYSCIDVREQGFRVSFAIYLYDLVTKTSTKVLDSDSQTMVWGAPTALLSPDGNSLLLNSGNPNHQINIYLLDLRTKALTQLTNDSNFSFQATAWNDDSQSFYLHQTLDHEPYVEKNFLMDLNGSLTPLVDVQGIITK